MKKELSEEDIKIQEELMYRIDQGPMKFQRTSLQYSMILKLVLTPIWVSFLIIFISKSTFLKRTHLSKVSDNEDDDEPFYVMLRTRNGTTCSILSF